MKRSSDCLREYTGPNPFHESQARAGSAAKILSEFFPTSAFWSLFNNQHEILLGTRGSGKTFLLRMMSYTLLRDFVDDRARSIVKDKSFICFYIPLHLEFLASLAGQECAEEDKLEYFQFAFNCAAAKALLTEVRALLTDCYAEPAKRLVAEDAVIQLCSDIWFGSRSNQTTTVRDLQWQIEQLFATTPFWKNARSPAMPLARPILAPIVSLLARLNEKLGLNADTTSWVACVDEAEFLKTSFLRCINAFLRTEKRPLVLKMATLPFKHTTLETSSDGVFIEPNGNDFNYRQVDLDCESTDFIGLTDYICKVRLERVCCPSDTTLETFLGKMGNDDLIDYYRDEMGAEEASDSVLLERIIESLSPIRQRNYRGVKTEPEKVDRPYLHRFMPVYFARRMRLENKKGARTAAWFAGPTTIRRVADGNPRRFIQIGRHLVETARSHELTPRKQHRFLTDFCKRYFEDIEGYPECGPFLKKIIESVGELLSDRVHGQYMVDSGCAFFIDSKLLDVGLIETTVKFAIDYALIIPDTETFLGDLDSKSNLRLSYVFAVYYWLPMRKGEPPVLRSKHAMIPTVLIEGEVDLRKPAPDVMDTFQLELFSQNLDETVTAVATN